MLLICRSKNGYKEVKEKKNAVADPSQMFKLKSHRSYAIKTKKILAYQCCAFKDYLNNLKSKF